VTQPTPVMLRQLRRACLAAASEAFACHPSYSYPRPPDESPLAGHCGVVATMIQKMFGGEIVGGKVDGCRHFWNRLPDGREVDLTSCQFGGDGITPVARGRVQRGGDRRLVELLAVMFAVRVQAELGNEPSTSKGDADEP
jgi:hypothetical protein